MECNLVHQCEYSHLEILVCANSDKGRVWEGKRPQRRARDVVSVTPLYYMQSGSVLVLCVEENLNMNTVNSRYIELGYNEMTAYIEVNLFP